MAKTYGNFTDFIDFSRASSGTYLGSDGLLKTAADNVPRIEYDANGNEIGLLIEEQRTNLLPYSEDFSNASWTAINSATKSASAVVAPDGSQNAYELTYPSTNGAVYEIVTVTASVHSFSVWLKADEVGQIRLARTGLGSDGENVTVTTEWQRFDVQITPTTTSDGPQIRRDATDQLTKVYVWGAQLEQGSFATSYIGTNGSTETRAADIASIATSNFGYNKKAGTVVVEASSAGTSNSSYPRLWELNVGAGSDRISQWVNTSNSIAMSADVGSVSQVNTTVVTGYTPNEEVSLAYGFKKDNFAASDNGNAVDTDGTGDLPSGITTLWLGQQHGGGQIINGHLRSIKYLPRRNTNTQLQEFTS